MTTPSDELLRIAVGAAIAGPSPPGRVFNPSAPSDLLPDPDPYVVYTVDTYGNLDLFTELVDVNVDIYGMDVLPTSNPAAVSAIVQGIHAALNGVILLDCGGSITAFRRTRRQPLPTEDARITRTRLTYQATWASFDAAEALGGAHA